MKEGRRGVKEGMKEGSEGWVKVGVGGNEGGDREEGGEGGERGEGEGGGNEEGRRGE